MQCVITHCMPEVSGLIVIALATSLSSNDPLLIRLGIDGFAIL
jgi:hypothetical protein